jgi:hypothetical protein
MINIWLAEERRRLFNVLILATRIGFITVSYSYNSIFSTPILLKTLVETVYLRRGDGFAVVTILRCHRYASLGLIHGLSSRMHKISSPFIIS